MQLKLFIITALASCSFAATVSSNGSGGGNWHATSSWSGGVVPSATDSVTIVVTDTLVCEPTQTCTVSGGGSLTINGSFKYQVNISMAANVTVGAVGKLINDASPPGS